MTDGSTDQKETVVLLHGIGRTGNSMSIVEYALKRDGYDVLNITYPSTKLTLEDLAMNLHEQLSLSPLFNSSSKVHFVTHSMGGIVTRYYLGKYKPDNLGRVVMMGPPNKGSEFADWLTDTEHLKPLFNKIFGPAGEQMKTASEYAPEAMKIDYEVGVIAGSLSINPLAPLILPNDNESEGHDGIVPIENTYIKGMKDHIVLPATHTLMMNNPRVIKEIKAFLKTGQFSAKPPSLN